MNWLHRDELGVFLNDAGLFGPGVEVGSRSGDFAATILARWRGRSLTLVDPWEPQPRSAYFDLANDASLRADAYASARRLAESDSRVRLLRGYSPDASRSFADGSLDFVYLDGNHAYPAVSDDLRAWYPKIRPGGLLAGHDYLDGIAANTLFGVRTAVDDFARSVGLAAAFTTADPPFVSWYLRKPMCPTPPPERVVVLTAYPVAAASIGAIARENREAYCARHGYRFVCRTGDFDPSRPANWSKLRFIRDELSAADWVFWADPRALVMNLSTPVTRFGQDCADLVLAADPRLGVRASQMLVRGTRWSAEFLDRVFAAAESTGGPRGLESAIWSLYAGDAGVRRRVAVVPPKLFSAEPYLGGSYAPGDFVVHFSDLGEEELQAAVRSFAMMAR